MYGKVIESHYNSDASAGSWLSILHIIYNITHNFCLDNVQRDIPYGLAIYNTQYITILHV